MYDRLEKTHELLWKQEHLHTAELSAHILLTMDEDEFQAHYNHIAELHLFQWSQKRDRIQQIMVMQKVLDKSFNLKDRFEMNEYVLASTFDKVKSDYQTFLGGTESSYLLEMELFGDLKNEDNEDNDAAVCRDREYDFDGEDDDYDDEDDERIVFTGRP